jgi:hypothetical protein
MFPQLSLVRRMALSAAFAAVIAAPCTLSAQDGTMVAPADTLESTPSLAADSPDVATTSQPTSVVNTPAQQASIAADVPQAAPVLQPGAVVDASALNFSSKQAQPVAEEVSPETNAQKQAAAEAQALGRVTASKSTASKPAAKKTKTTASSRKPSSRPTYAKPAAPPPVIGGVYYPPSSPVYEANGYTWGHEPGRYNPGRYTPGRYTPGRYTPGRYVPPGGAAAAVLEAEAAQERPIRRTRTQAPTRVTRTYDYSEPTYGSLHGNGAVVGHGGYGYYSAPVIISPGRDERGW